MSTLLNTAGASSWQTGFLHILPRIQTHAQIKFRRLPAAQREEAIAEAIASACVSYQLLAAQGRLHDAYASTVADYAVKFVCNGRHVGGPQDTAKDVLSPKARQRHGVRTVSLERHGGGSRSLGWKQVAIESRRMPVADLAAFRIDFASWLGSLARRDRRIIAAMMSGEGTLAVAGRYGLSPGRISQLRREYESKWMKFQGQTGPDMAA